jgi:hypothetical protein
MIEVIENEVKTRKINYPIIMKSVIENDYIIVLFTGDSSGIVLRSNCDEECVGEFYEDYFAMDVFTPYNEPLTIQNKIED